MFTTGQTTEGAVIATDINAVCGTLATSYAPLNAVNVANYSLPKVQGCASPIGPKWVAAVTSWFAALIDSGKQTFKPGNVCQDPNVIVAAVKSVARQGVCASEVDSALPATFSYVICDGTGETKLLNKSLVKDDICSLPLRTLATTPLTAATRMSIQECPGGILDSILVGDLLNDCSRTPKLPATSPVPVSTSWIMVYDSNCNKLLIPLSRILATPAPAPTGAPSTSFQCGAVTTSCGGRGTCGIGGYGA